MTLEFRESIRAWWLMLAILLAFAALIVPTLDRQGVNWDEQTDLDITRVYVESDYGLVHGSPDDAINTRLPMYATGLLLRLVPVEPLWLARLLSVLVSGSAVLAVFLFCSIQFDRTKGLVAAAILASSPYFLFFGKQALTEGDAWIAAAVAWFVVAGAAFAAKPTLGRAAAVGVALGLAFSAKISGMALVPAWVLAALVVWRRARGSESGRDESGPRLRPRDAVIATTAFALWMSVNAVIALGTLTRFGGSVLPRDTMPVVRWSLGLALALWLASRIWKARRDRPAAIWTIWSSLLVAALVFVLVPPVHTTNPWILGSLGKQVLGDGSGIDFAFVLEALYFHVEVITLKSSLMIGLGLWVALAVAARRRWREAGSLLVLLSIAFYVAFVLLLPWAQTRYLMPVLPLLTIFAADSLVDLYRARRRLAVGIAAFASVVLVGDLATSYPDLNLNGYPLVGERFLTGRSTVGYRGVVHTPSDGIEQALRWTARNASPGDSLVTVFGELHITRAVPETSTLKVGSALHGTARLEDARWVITSINYDIVPRRKEHPEANSIYGYPWYDRALLEREFSKVFVVERAFGIEVAAVWRRHPHAEKPNLVETRKR